MEPGSVRTAAAQKNGRKAMATKKARRTMLLVVAGVDILRIEPRP